MFVYLKRPDEDKLMQQTAERQDTPEKWINRGLEIPKIMEDTRSAANDVISNRNEEAIEAIKPVLREALFDYLEQGGALQKREGNHLTMDLKRVWKLDLGNSITPHVIRKGKSKVLAPHLKSLERFARLIKSNKREDILSELLKDFTIDLVNTGDIDSTKTINDLILDGPEKAQNPETLLRNALLEYMQEQNCLEKTPDRKNWLIDVEKFKGLDIPYLLTQDETILNHDSVLYPYREAYREISKTIDQKPGAKNNLSYSIFYRLFKDFKAVPMNSASENPSQEPRPLLFTPDSNNPYSLDQYKNPSALMSIIDAGTGAFPINTFKYDDLSLDQSRKSWIPYYLYHPNWGAGERDKDGKLIVSWRDKDKNVRFRKPISFDWMYSKYIGYGANGNMSNLKFGGKAMHNSSPHKIIQTYCTDLTKAGVIKPDDFQLMSEGRPTVLTTKKIDQRVGMIMMDGQRYTLGAPYNGSTLTKIEEGLWLIENPDGKKSLFRPMNAPELESRQRQLQKEGKKNPGAFPIGQRDKDFDWKTHLVAVPDSDRQLEIDKESVSPLSRLQLIKYIGTDTLKLERLQKGLKNPYVKEAKESVINAFIACDYDAGIGDIILDLIEKQPTAAPRVFKQFNEILELYKQQEKELIEKINQSENTTHLKVDRGKLLKITQKHGAQLIRKFASLAEKNDFDSIYKLVDDDMQAYRKEILETAGIFSAVAGEGTSPDAVNQISKNTRVDTVQCGDLIKDKSREAMQNPDNYLYPEQFSVEDYRMIVRNLERAYSEIDPGWLEHLIDNIPNDLSNQNVEFLMIRDKNQKLVGTCKIKQKGEKEYYMGTLYVEPEYQQGFGMGQYLDAYLRENVEKDAKVEGTVAAANRAASRHIDVRGFVGTDIVTEGEGDKKSRPLINLDLNPQEKFATQDKTVFTEERIQDIHAGKETLINPDIKVILTDTSGNHAEVYTEELKPLFKQGYALTRFFYSDKDNQRETYLVLEKRKGAEADTKEENAEEVRRAG